MPRSAAVTPDQFITFGELLKFLRRRAGLTQRELSIAVGYSDSQISRLEQNQRPPDAASLTARFVPALSLEAERDWVARLLELAPAAGTESRPEQRESPAEAPSGLLPNGTVTFLFTDIEGSTQLWQRHREAMPAALARHHAILKDAIAAHGGHVFQIVGDAFCAAFATPAAGVRAALTAQRALRDEAWGATGPLPVRMALHSGTTPIQAGDYVSGEYRSGITLSRAARLLSAAHGGQTLLSRASYELLRDQLPDGITLRDLGEHQLKDLIQPEHIYQVVAPDMAAEFPPLNALPTVRHNLPLQLTSFIGRERELEAVCQRLLRTDLRLLTLTGPGGTGKTRLSLQAATELLDEFPDGVYFVSLAPISDSAHVLSAITRALGLEAGSGRAPLETAKNYLSEKRLLLMLDNFEQVAAAAPMVVELLAAAPGLKALITSRNVLHLYGEHDYAVPPLSLPDPKQLPPLERLAQYEALRLFIERAQAARADFAVTPENAQAVAQICQHLDGLPLAIELAAARTRLLSPQDILARLHNRLSLLTGGGQDRPARHQTLRGAIAWSYDLLDKGGRTLFARLAVFVGGCTLAAAEAVCNGANDLPLAVLNGIGSLVDQSLLKQTQDEGEARFFILETIREYALEQLEASDEAAVVRSRHADYYLALAELAFLGQSGPDPRDWLNRLETEHENLLAALEWAQRNDFERALRLASALGWFWFSHGYRQEGIQRLQSLLARPEAAARTAVRARALVELVALEQYSSAAADLGDEAISIYRELNDKPGLASAYHWRAITAYQAEGQLDVALSLFAEALTLFRQFGNQWGITRALDHMGIILSDRGDYAGARALLKESLTLCRESGDKRGSANVLFSLALDAEEAGDLARARALLEESVALYGQWGDSLSVAGPLEELGEVLGRQGEYMLARQKVDEAYRLHQRSGEKQLAAYDLWIMGRVSLAEGNTAQAKNELRECLVLGHKQGAREAIARCLPEFARLAAYSHGQAARVARLLGASERSLEDIRFVGPSYRVEWHQAAVTARLELGEAAFTSAWAEGRAMTQDEAVEYALEPVA